MEEEQVTGTGHDCMQGSSCSYSPANRTNSAQYIKPTLGFILLALILTHLYMFNHSILGQMQPKDPGKFVFIPSSATGFVCVLRLVSLGVATLEA